METIEERCKKFATRNYVNSDGEVVATIVDVAVYNNVLVVAKTVKEEMIEKACKWIEQCTLKRPIKHSELEIVLHAFRKAMEGVV